MLGYYVKFPNTNAGSNGGLNLELVKGRYAVIIWKQDEDERWSFKNTQIITVKE